MTEKGTQMAPTFRKQKQSMQTLAAKRAFRKSIKKIPGSPKGRFCRSGCYEDITLLGRRVQGSTRARGLVKKNRRISSWTFNFFFRPLLVVGTFVNKAIH